MAQKTIINNVCDVDGTEAAFVHFQLGLDGVTYELDLSQASRDRLFRDLEDFLAVARRIGGRRRSTTANGTNGRSTGDTGRNQLIREWARENGHPLGDRGRIPNQVVEAYDKAHSQSAPAPAEPAASTPRKQTARRPRATKRTTTKKAATKTA